MAGGTAFLVLLALWSVNLLASVILDVQKEVARRFLPSDSRVALPNYPDKARAKQILGEFKQLQTRFVPFVDWTREPFRGQTTTIDATGQRVHPDTTARPVGTVRFFGGSTMWGSGVADDETIPAAFNQLHPDYRVHNHGESGYTSRQSLDALINQVNQNAPMDLVVFYDGNNDVGTFCWPWVGINSHTQAAKIQRLVRPRSYVLADLTGSIEEIARGKLFSRLFAPEDPFQTLCHTDPAHARRVAETMINDWKIARATAAVGGADFLAVLQPVASIGAPRTDHLSDDERSPHTAQNVVYPIIRELMGREGADWIVDFSRVFDGDEYIFIDECHVTENGNRRIAERLDAVAGPLLRRRRDAVGGS